MEQICSHRKPTLTTPCCQTIRLQNHEKIPKKCGTLFGSLQYKIYSLDQNLISNSFFPYNTSYVALVKFENILFCVLACKMSVFPFFAPKLNKTPESC